MPVSTAPFRRGEKVISTEAISHVPEGTAGKVMLVNGFSWIRYWVHFADGTEVGSIDQSKLVRAKEWTTFVTDQDQAELAGDTDVDEADGAAGGDDGAGGGGGDDGMVNGVAIPGYLLERSQNARTRLGA